VEERQDRPVAGSMRRQLTQDRAVDEGFVDLKAASAGLAAVDELERRIVRRSAAVDAVAGLRGFGIQSDREHVADAGAVLPDGAPGLIVERVSTDVLSS
jgi:hypothetical protein